MDSVLEVTDKTGKKIRLTKRQWTHIREDHPEVEDFEEIEETLRKPDKIIENDLAYYYKYYKHKKSSQRYLLVLVNYLNGEGFVVTAYRLPSIK